MYKDRKVVRNSTEWSPSRLYYLGFVPSFIGAAVILYYLYKRNKFVGEQEQQDKERRETNQNYVQAKGEVPPTTYRDTAPQNNDTW